MSIVSYLPNEDHEALMQDFTDVLAVHAHLPPDELLSIAAQLVGNLVAMQDPHLFTSMEQVLTVIARNIEEGNAYAIAKSLGNCAGGRH